MAVISMKNVASSSLNAAFIGGIGVCVSASDVKLSAFHGPYDVIATWLF